VGLTRALTVGIRVRSVMATVKKREPTEVRDNDITECYTKCFTLPH